MLPQLVRRFIAPYRREVLLVLVLQFAATVSSLYLPGLNARIIDDGVARGDVPEIWRLGGIMLAVTLVQIVCSIGAVYVGARVAMSVGRDLRQAVFDKVGTFSDREIAEFTPASLITRNTNDVTQVQTLVAMVLTVFVMAPIMSVGGVVMAIRESAGLAWLLLVSVPLLAVGVSLIVVQMVPGYRRMQTSLDDINGVLREQITGIRVVRAFVRERHEADRFAVANDEQTEIALGVTRLMARMFPYVLAVMNLSSLAVLWFGAQRVDGGHLGVGSVMAFLAYLVQILMAVMMATFVATMIPRASVSAERVADVLAAEPSILPPEHPSPAPPRRGMLELRDVRFQYHGADDAVLDGVTLSAEPGRTTAIIGSTGSGKSTLVSLIPRLFDVTGGAVLVDGVDVREYRPDDLWQRIGLVPQTSYLFTGTVASNLRFGNPDASDDQLWRALRIAQAADFVSAMPGGLDALIAQGGVNVSGGQRQRLAIARALVREPDVYVFDDSFSALDVSTDARLRAALRRSIEGATVLVVAQRVSTIRDADQIVVLDNGRVVGIGRHDDLVRSCDTYAEIVASQLSAGAPR